MIEIKTTYNCIGVWHEPRYFNPVTINFNHTEVRIDNVVYAEDSEAYQDAVIREQEKQKMWLRLNQ